MSVIIVIVAIFLIVANSPYLGCNYSDPEIAVVGTAFHIFEWIFVRVAPVVLVGVVVGIFVTRKR